MSLKIVWLGVNIYEVEKYSLIIKEEEFKMKDKVLKKSPIVIALYVVAALLLAYAVYTVISTLAAIASYAAQMEGGMKTGEIIGYVLQALVTPLTSAVTVGAAGFILNETRKLNPENYVSMKEIEAAKAAKEAAKLAKVAEKAAKTAEKNEEPVEVKTEAKPVEKATEKAPEKKPAAKKTTTTKKPAAKKTTDTKKPATKKPAADKPKAGKTEAK